MLLTDLYSLYKSKNRNLRAESTDNRFRISLRHFNSAIGRATTSDDLTDDNLVSLEKHLADRSPYTINGVTGSIKTLWRWAAKHSLVTVWPTLQRLDTPEPEKPTWDVNDVRKLLDACSQLGRKYYDTPRNLWWGSLIRMLWDTGERIGSLRSCRWEWLRGSILQIPATARKGWKSSTYRVSDATLSSLTIIREPQRELIWPFPMSLQTFYNHYGHILVAAGLPDGRKFKSQCMRRTHLTLWALAGHDASARAQHTSRAVTERFYLDSTRLPQIDPSTVLPPL